MSIGIDTIHGEGVRGARSATQSRACGAFQSEVPKPIASTCMKIENVLHIAAPPATVWAVTEDVERWPEWTPTVESARRMDGGRFDVGSTVTIKQPGLPDVQWTVTKMVRGERFTWTGCARGIRMTASHEVAPDGDGTRSTLRIELSGVVVALSWPLLRIAVGRALRRENAGLKSRCENLVRGPEPQAS